MRDLVWPREHGSWSFVLEPVALGLIAVPSVAGGGLAVAVAAAFFARRPLGIAVRDPDANRRRAAGATLGVCAGFGLLGLSVAVAFAGVAWLLWLLPSVIAGACFLAFDLRRAGRSGLAEISGVASFGLLPAAIAAVGGAAPAMSVALAVVMCGRAVPTVLCVREALRGAKSGVTHRIPALLAAFLAVAVAAPLVAVGAAPWMSVAALAVLALRALALLVFPRPALRARSIGMIEAMLGVAFVAVVGIAAN